MIDAVEKDKHLPQSIEAFFFVEGCNGQGVLGKMCTGRKGARRVHEAFVRANKNANVPLLMLRPHNWSAPFAVDVDD